MTAAVWICNLGHAEANGFIGRGWRPLWYNATGMRKAYDEIIDFIAHGTTPSSVAAFEASEAARQRAADLLELKKSRPLQEEEESELESFLMLEHIMRLAKARARMQVQ